VLVELEPQLQAVTPDFDEVHAVCHCSPDIALCGTDRAGAPWQPDDTPLTCVVCEDLEYAPCSRCGE
jgi:hypothetical protein